MPQFGEVNAGLSEHREKPRFLIANVFLHGMDEGLKASGGRAVVGLSTFQLDDQFLENLMDNDAVGNLRRGLTGFFQCGVKDLFLKLRMQCEGIASLPNQQVSIGCLAGLLERLEELL